MKVGDVFVALGFDVDDATLKGFDDKIAGLTGNMWAAAAATAGTVYAINAFVQKAVQGAAALRNFRLETGLSQEALREWQIVGQLTNIQLTAEAVTGSIKNLQKNINNVNWGQGNPAAFKWLGIDVMHGQDAFNVMEQLRDKMALNLQRFGRARTVQLISELGLDPGFISALTLTRQEFEKLYKGKILNSQELDKLNKLGFSIQELTVKWEYLTSHITAKFAPELIKIIDWAIPHIEAVFRGVERVGTFLLDNLPTIKALMISFAPIIAVWAVTAHPFLTALILVLSLLEAIGNYKPGDGGVIDTMVKGAKELVDLLNIIDAWLGKHVVNPLKNAFSWDGFKKNFLGMDGDDNKGKKSSWFSNEPDNPLNRTNETLKGVGETMREAANNLRDLHEGMTGQGVMKAAYLGMGLSGARVQISNQYAIHGNSDPSGTAREIVDHQQRQLNHSMESFNNGSKN